MPELPEVETIRLGLERELVGRTVVSVDWRGSAFRKASPQPLNQLAGRQVLHIDRHAKFLFVRLDNGATWLVHLGMTGKLLFHGLGDAEAPHTHLRLELDDGRELRYVDPRRFGMLRLYGPGQLVEDVDHYGPDALDPAFTATVLADAMRTSRAPMKAFLLDQTKVAGLGNIYVCEALWRAGISPRRKACNVAKAKVVPLYQQILAVLQDALADGGTSFNDYVNTIGDPGTFVSNLAVFQREGAPCLRPGCPGQVTRIVQSGRSTFYCSRCQR